MTDGTPSYPAVSDSPAAGDTGNSYYDDEYDDDDQKHNKGLSYT